MRSRLTRRRLVTATSIAIAGFVLVVLLTRGGDRPAHVVTGGSSSTTVAPRTSVESAASTTTSELTLEPPTAPTDGDLAAPDTPAASTDTTLPAGVALSPDALLYHRGGEVHAVNPDGSGDTVLFTEPEWISDVRWSPDHRQVAAATPRGLVVRNANGDNARVVASGGPQGIAWSPDGSRLAYVCPGAEHSVICVAGSDGSDATVVTPPDEYAALDPDWSPDGTRLAYVRAHTDQSESITVLDLGTGALTDLVTVNTGFDSGPEYVNHPRWSPTQPVIVYGHKPATDVRDDIWVVGTDGTDAHELVGDPQGINPQWSPDGTRLALQPNLSYVEYPDPRYASLIYIVDADGTNGRSLPIPSDTSSALDDW